MAKSKNHSNHNQNRKAHKNGIRKMKPGSNKSTKGMCPKYIRNIRFSRKGNDASDSGSEVSKEE